MHLAEKILLPQPPTSAGDYPIDKQFLDTPFYGVRQMTWHLQNEGHAVNEKRIRRLMRLMRLMPIYQKPNTSKPAKGHKTYPPSQHDQLRRLRP